MHKNILLFVSQRRSECGGGGGRSRRMGGNRGNLSGETVVVETKFSQKKVGNRYAAVVFVVSAGRIQIFEARGNMAA